MENCWARPWIGPRTTNSSHRRNNWTVSSEFGENLKQTCRGCVYLLWSKLKTKLDNQQWSCGLNPRRAHCVCFIHMPTFQPWHRCLDQAGSSREPCGNKLKKRPLHSHGTFWPGFDERALQALAQTLWKNASRQSSAFFFISSALSLNTRRLFAGQSKRRAGAPSTSLQHGEENEKLEGKMDSGLGRLKGQVWVTWPERSGWVWAAASWNDNGDSVIQVKWSLI